MRINVVYIGGIAYAADIADRDWYLKILRGKVEEWGVEGALGGEGRRV